MRSAAFPPILTEGRPLRKTLFTAAATAIASTALAAVAVLPAQAQPAAPAAAASPAFRAPTALCTTQLAVTRKVAREMHIQLGTWKTPLPSKALRARVVRQLRAANMDAQADAARAITGLKSDKRFVRVLTLQTWRILAGHANCGYPLSGL